MYFHKYTCTHVHGKFTHNLLYKLTAYVKLLSNLDRLPMTKVDCLENYGSQLLNFVLNRFFASEISKQIYNLFSA